MFFLHQPVFIGILITSTLVSPPNVPATPIQQELKTNKNVIVVETSSGASEVGLAKYLVQIHAKMYGAYWCPHCQAQLSMFGKEASEILDHIECDPNGKAPNPDLCKRERVTGYPYWIIQGRRYAGTQSLNALANASAYKGLRNFKNPNPELR